MRQVVLWLCLATSVGAYADPSDLAPLSQNASQKSFSDAEVQNYASGRYRALISNLALQSALDDDPELLFRARKILSTLLATAKALKPDAAEWQWELHVTSSDDYDGLCLAGGKILLGAGFIRTLKLSDPELAMVIAHEVAHALAQHQGEELSSARSLLPAKFPRALKDVVSAMRFDYGMQIKLASLSRRQEIEADRLGLLLASRAGWSMPALIGFFEKLSNNDDGRGDFTHPSPDARLYYVKRTAATMIP